MPCFARERQIDDHGFKLRVVKIMRHKVLDAGIPAAPVELPQAIIDSLARFLVPEIRKYYESEQGQREFEEWLEKQEREEDNK